MPTEGPLIIIAGAGSGKTATLTNRLASLITRGVPPSEILAITFTNKAAGEMKDRVSNLLKSAKPSSSLSSEPTVSTFHSFGARLLRREASRVGRRLNFSIFDDNDSKRLLRQVMKEAGISPKECGLPVVSFHISAIKNEIPISTNKEDKIKNLSVIIDKINSLYEDALLQNNAFDFDDLISKPVSIFNSHPDLLEFYRRRFRFILVDEYQDINPIQYRLLKQLADASGNINVVGDDNQAIYGFRGAVSNVFDSFRTRFTNHRLVVLEQNYRSTKNIIGAAGSLISKNRRQIAKQLWTENEDGAKVKIKEHLNEDEESIWIAEALSSSADFNSQAVLYRVNAQSRPLEQALMEKGIPYIVVGGLKFYDRKEIKDLVAALRYAFNPSDSVSLNRLFTNFYKKDARHLQEILPFLASSSSPRDILEYVIQAIDFPVFLAKKHPNASERMENVSELLTVVGKFSDLSSALERISLFQSWDEADASLSKNSINPVNLMTIHAAKGLEFDRVFVAGVSEGLLPHHRSLNNEEEISEERRLLYVAMTRAKKDLSLSFFDIPSRFLSDIDSSFIEYIPYSSEENPRDLDDEERYIILD